MTAMICDAKLAIESFIDSAAVLNFLVLVLLAKELTRLVAEVTELVKNTLLQLLFL